VGWYQERLDELFDLGADAIKTDFGEVIAEDVSYYGGSAPELRNLYSLLYQKAAFESTQRRKGKDALIWTRAGWAGCQRYPIHWGGDCAATWDGMTASLRGGLHLGLSGFGYWSHDVPGFHGLPDFMNSRPDDELVVRWTQFASFTSHFRFHGTTPREPWEFPAVSGLLRDWFKLRYALIPYLCQEGKKVAENGPPILAALSFYHPKDKICWMIDDQYYFGDDILVAPQLQPGGVRDVYLPEGKWVDMWSGIRTTGPIWLHEYESPLERCPIFVREGASIPVYPKPVSSTLDIQWDQVVSMPFDYTYEGFATSAIRDCGSFGLNHQVQPL
jgi:alpha-D-xyloside xylohydrolase